MGNWLSHNWPSQRQRERAEEESTEGASTPTKRAKKESTEGSSSISPEATSANSGQYDVFLSFNGLDTRKEFTDHLYHSLKNAGIVPFRVFKDDKSIPIGEEFPSQIFDAITQSKISIPIISKNYASSKWCLRELIHIMDCKKRSSQIVLPIFYKVTPSDVRHLAGNFGDAFRSRLSQGHFDEKIIQEGPEALREVSDLHGWESTKVANGHEEELIQLVVKIVLSKLQKDFQLDIPGKLVGLDDHLMEIINWIRSPSIDARMIGIYGMGGIGKTTLAKCIYNQLLNEFECASFLPDIREKATYHDGMKDLQSQLIYDILQSENKLSTIDEGIIIIKSRVKRKKVLILLDDIDNKNQLDVLARERDWFMAGSMIIVTTRNEAVLDQSEFEVDYKYGMEGLDEMQSLLLFNRHAFRIDHSPRDFESISRDIVSTMGGLPLALEVVGSSLYKKTNKEVWEDVRRQLKSQLHRDVEKILRISYNALEDGYKQIFLDIACFFISGHLIYRGKYMMSMWDGCGLYPSLGIEELKLRCLIKIGKSGVFEMHDQLRDLARSIFCEKQPPEERSGPWNDDYEGVPRVLSSYKYGRRFHDLMRAASRGDKDLSEVRWLLWEINESDSSLLTANLRLPKLVVLELDLGEMTEDWEGWGSLRASTRLRALDLFNCLNLRSSPDLSAFTQLKILRFNGCSRLKHIHPSIAKLKSLVSLGLPSCKSLEELPEGVGKLKDLEELDLSNSGITQIPTSIHSLGKLKKLDVSHCKSLTEIPSSIGGLQNLQHLNISCSGIEEFPSVIGRLKNLQTLNLFGLPISDLPESIRNLSSLRRLDLNSCFKLQSLPELPSSLEHLVVSGQSLRLPQLRNLIHLEELRLGGCHLPEDISDLPSRLWKLDGFRYLEVISIIDCSSIEILDLSELVHLRKLFARNCQNLVEIQGLENLEFLDDIYIKFCNSINKLLCLKSRRLKKIDVLICDNLVEIQGPLNGAKFLEQLTIEECNSLETLQDLTGCEKLQSLVVRDCNKLTQLQGPLDGAKFLKQLYIKECNSLETLPDLTGCEELQFLVIRDCKKLTQLPVPEKLDLIDWDISGCDSLEAIPKLSGRQLLSERSSYRPILGATRWKQPQNHFESIFRDFEREMY